MTQDAHFDAVRAAQREVDRAEWALLVARGRRQEAVAAALGSGKTLRALAALLGMSAERVRQIAAKPVAAPPEPPERRTLTVAEVVALKLADRDD